MGLRMRDKRENREKVENCLSLENIMELKCDDLDLNVDKILQDVVSSDKFSKLVHKLEYHQLELHPEMRKAMTFVIQCGLY